MDRRLSGVEAYFLKNVEEEGNRRPKLVLRRHDQATLQAILDGTDPPMGRVRTYSREL